METLDFSRSSTHLEIPSLLSLQLDSFREFAQFDTEPARREPNGLEGVLRETFPIEDAHKNFRLEYVGYNFGEPKYSPDEAWPRASTIRCP